VSAGLSVLVVYDTVDATPRRVTHLTTIKFETRHDLELWVMRCADGESPLLADVDMKCHGTRATVIKRAYTFGVHHDGD
jgi:hypothetical protein